MRNLKHKRILVTGGAGFIGSHLLLRLVPAYKDCTFYNLDLLTYAGNLMNLKAIERAPNYKFIQGDIGDKEFIRTLFQKEKFDGVIHLAAESHVDRSIRDPNAFLRTNIMGTAHLLNAFKELLDQGHIQAEHALFYHVSTDEVYGSLGPTGYFTEETPYDPKSPYSSSKAASDHLVRAWNHTYGLPAVISNCSNNYGPMQFPEKLIPLTILRISNMESIPVYGKGDQIRDWLWVEEHAQAIDAIFNRGRIGETYNIGGSNEKQNLDVVHALCSIMDKKLDRVQGTSAQLIKFVKDRPGHDRRYAIDCSKLKKELGWKPSMEFKEGLERTAEWYLSHPEWVQAVQTGAYKEYMSQQYAG